MSRSTLRAGMARSTAAAEAARARASGQWADVQTVTDGGGYLVTAQRVCTDCGGTINSDDELRAHWRGQHENGGSTDA